MAVLLVLVIGFVLSTGLRKADSSELTLDTAGFESDSSSVNSELFSQFTVFSDSDSDTSQYSSSSEQSPELALHHAALNGELELVVDLLDSSDALVDKGPALRAGVCIGRVDIVNKILESYVNPGKRSHDSSNAIGHLFEMCDAFELERETLIDLFDILMPLVQDYMKLKLLVTACRSSMDMFQLLLESQYFSASQKSLGISKCMDAAVASADSQKFDVLLHSNHITPEKLASSVREVFNRALDFELVDGVSMVLASGFPVDLSNSLNKAFRNENLAIVKLIIETLDSSPKSLNIKNEFLLRLVRKYLSTKGSGELLDLIDELLRESTTSTRDQILVLTAKKQDHKLFEMVVALETPNLSQLSSNSESAGECQYQVEGNTLSIDGQGSWNMILTCLSEDAVKNSDSLLIHNTGPLHPPISPFKDASLLAHTLTLQNIPNFKYIPIAFFKGLDHLSTLNLEKLGIAKVFPQNFDGVSGTLHHLNLRDNNIKEMVTESGKYSYLPYLETLDLTGNPLIRGCIPENLEVIPVGMLPFCSGYTDRMDALKAQPRNPYGVPSSEMYNNFICKDAEDQSFLKQPLRHVYKLGVEKGSHFGLVFMFDHGMMLSELTSPGDFISIKSTCIAANLRGIAEESNLPPDAFPTLMFTLHSPVWRHRRSGMTLSDYLDNHRTLVLEDMAITESSGITAELLLKECDEYQAEHRVFERNSIDSCITFAHLMYKKIQEMELENQVP